MPRTSITPIIIPGPYEAAPHIALTWVAADVANGNQFALSGDQVLLVRNDDAAPQTVTITSVADPYGRTGHITALSIPAGAYKAFARFSPTGWKQTDGMLYLSGATTTIMFAVLDLRFNQKFTA